MGGASESIFRKTALERLCSPDQLDRLITLTSPLGWAAAAAVLILMAAIVGWSIFGSVATRVSGAGILVLRGGSVFDAMAPAAGVLTSVAAVGSSVAKGEVVATLDDTQAEQDLQHARNALHEQEQDLAQLVARFDREIAARRQVNTLLRRAAFRECGRVWRRDRGSDRGAHGAAVGAGGRLRFRQDLVYERKPGGFELHSRGGRVALAGLAGAGLLGDLLHAGRNSAGEITAELASAGTDVFVAADLLQQLYDRGL